MYFDVIEFTVSRSRVNLYFEIAALYLELILQGFLIIRIDTYKIVAEIQLTPSTSQIFEQFISSTCH